MLSQKIRNTEARMQHWRFGVKLEPDHAAEVAATLYDLANQASELEIAALPKGGCGRLNATCVSEPLEALRETFAAMAHDGCELRPTSVKQFRLILTTAAADAEKLEACAARTDLPDDVADFQSFRDHPGRIAGYARQPSLGRPAPSGPGAVA